MHAHCNESGRSNARVLTRQTYTAQLNDGRWQVIMSKAFSDGSTADCPTRQHDSLRQALLEIENALSYAISPTLIDID
jgi:hypothetical protein